MSARTHLDAAGAANMVDVTDKAATTRTARAEGVVVMQPETLRLIREGDAKKGDVIGTAQSGLPRFRIADLERQAGLMALARRDAQAFLDRDPAMTGERAPAVRLLLWLMEQDRAIRLIAAG